jgi:hypothetical protein
MGRMLLQCFLARPGPAIAKYVFRCLGCRALWVRIYQCHGRRSSKGGDRHMCYTRRDYGFEEEARKLRMEEESRRRREEEAQRAKEKQEKPLTEKVKEMVGVR